MKENRWFFGEGLSQNQSLLHVEQETLGVIFGHCGFIMLNENSRRLGLQSNRGGHSREMTPGDWRKGPKGGPPSPPPPFFLFFSFGGHHDG